MHKCKNVKCKKLRHLNDDTSNEILRGRQWRQKPGLTLSSRWDEKQEKLPLRFFLTISLEPGGDEVIILLCRPKDLRLNFI